MKKKIRSLLALTPILMTIHSIAQVVSYDLETPITFNQKLTTPLDGNGVQVNQFTGVANITVPFYQYKVGDLNLGVSMSYDAGGLAVDAVPSRLGSGWELSTGSYLKRIVRGDYDDLNRGGLLVDQVTPGVTPIGYWFTQEGTDQKKDDEPDLFLVNIGGKAFSMIIGKDGSVMTIPDNINVNIKMYINGDLFTGMLPHSTKNTGNTSFVITDADGNQFQFKNLKTVTIMNPDPAHPYPISVPTPTTEWQLVQVTPFEGQSIEYSYSMVQLTGLTDNNQQFREKYNNYGDPVNNTDPVTYISPKPIAVKYPNNIEVAFEYLTNRIDVPGDEMLTAVFVREQSALGGAAPLTRKYLLNHSYFYSPEYTSVIDPTPYLTGASSDEVSLGAASTSTDPSSYTRYRLKLNSIDEVGNDGSTKRYFAFGYNPVPLPQRFFGARDMFGYATILSPQIYHSNALYIPEHSFSDGIHPTLGTNNYPDPLVFDASLLTSITNDKGGEVSLNYRTAQVTATNIGGAITDKIVYYDGLSHDNDEILEYTYENQEHFLPEDNFIYNATTHYGGSWPGFPRTYTIFSIYGNTINSAIDAYSYGFKKVTETKKDINGALLAKTISTFNGLDNTDADGNYLGSNLYTPDFTSSDPDFNRAFNEAPFTKKQHLKTWLIGIPLKMEKYDNNNNIVNMTKFYYDCSTIYSSSSNFGGRHKLGNNLELNASEDNFDDFHDYYEDVYYPFTGHSLLTKVENRDYYNNTDYIAKVVNYGYDGHSNISSKWYINSRGETITENYKYNYDFSGTSGGAGVTRLNNYGVQKVVYSDKWKKIGSINYLIDVNAGISDIVETSGNHFIRQKYKYTLATPSSTPLTSFTPDMVGMANGSTIANFHLGIITTGYDIRGNAVETTDNAGSGYKVYNSKIIDLECSNEVVAEAMNAKNTEIGYTGFETAMSLFYSHLDYVETSISADHSLLGRYCYNLNTNLFSYDPNWLDIFGLDRGPSSSPTKYILSYWAYAGASITFYDGVELVPNTVNTMAPEAIMTRDGWTLYQVEFIPQADEMSFLGAGYIDEIKIHPVGSKMKTYNYAPLQGKTAEVDFNDKITTYEYDGFGNLSVIRDADKNIVSKTENHTQY